MNRYGVMALEFSQQHRPQALQTIEDPETFFTQAGEEIASLVTEVRDQVLGTQQPGEDVESYRRRSYQALRTAEELVLADHWLLIPEPEAETDLAESDELELREYYRALAEMNQAIVEAHQLLASDST